MSDDRAHVLDARRAGRRIQTFLTGVTQNRFIEDIEKQSAVLHQFTILGEAVRRVSAAFRTAHAHVDWSGVIGFRNLIVHDYDEVDVDIVWQLAHDDLLAFLTAIEPLVTESPDDEAEDS